VGETEPRSNLVSKRHKVAEAGDMVASGRILRPTEGQDLGASSVTLVELVDVELLHSRPQCSPSPHTQNRQADKLTNKLTNRQTETDSLTHRKRKTNNYSDRPSVALGLIYI
jgi:hypothetical protein